MKALPETSQAKTALVEQQLPEQIRASAPAMLFENCSLSNSSATLVVSSTSADVGDRSPNVTNEQTLMMRQQAVNLEKAAACSAKPSKPCTTLFLCGEARQLLLQSAMIDQDGALQRLRKGSFSSCHLSNTVAEATGRDHAAVAEEATMRAFDAPRRAHQRISLHSIHLPSLCKAPTWSLLFCRSGLECNLSATSNGATDHFSQWQRQSSQWLCWH